RMSDPIVESALFGAVMDDGAIVDGAWTATYNASDVLVSVTATFYVFDELDGTFTIFTAPTIEFGGTPSGTGSYEIDMTHAAGGDFSTLSVAWTGELPTTLTIGSTGHPSTIVTTNAAPTTPIHLSVLTGVVTSAVVCYCAGTQLQTPEGAVAVEDLAVGQTLMTASGAARPVRWIGHRKIDLLRHPEPELVRPIRIAAGALGDNVPSRDLLVSPDHGMLVDGALVPARLLVNHHSITEETRLAAVTYFHVELDSHDIILAEGAPAESYLDTGNRDIFANAPVTAITPDMSAGQRLRTPENGACMPLATEAETIFPIWQRLAARAGAEPAAGHVAASPGQAYAGLALIAGTRTLRPVVDEAGTVIFALPRDTTAVRLVSATARPSQSRPWLDDRRRLGVAVRHAAADHVALPLDGPAFGAGWWNLETSEAATYRWSNGDAILALPEGTRLLTLKVHAAMPQRGQQKHAHAA
ncbi:MAG TPA: Hint domain-containing protein, partial [Candidatus Sulfotelmatobacter sp.]|nr:Hint domain-containing protein [Candidatus Sulfotelmatobacter sp.]